MAQTLLLATRRHLDPFLMRFLAAGDRLSDDDRLRLADHGDRRGDNRIDHSVISFRGVFRRSIEVTSDIRHPRLRRGRGEAVDKQQGSTWSSHIVNDITRHCGTDYDEGQAAWGSPLEHDTLYTAWRDAAQLSWRMDLLGLPGFRAVVASLPADPEQAVKDLLVKLAVPPSHWRMFLLGEAFSIAGWASFVRYQVRKAEFTGRRDDDLHMDCGCRVGHRSAIILGRMSE